jgi:hypothetical protein
MRMLQPLLACLRTRPPLRWEINQHVCTFVNTYFCILHQFMGPTASMIFA